MEVPPQLLVLLPLSVAAGLQLYLTLLILGVALYLGVPLQGVEALPPETIPALAALAALYLAELAAEFHPRAALAWHNLQLLLRPFGGALLGIVLLHGQPGLLVALGVAMAGVVAAFSHVILWGHGLISRMVPDGHLSPFALRGVADLGALALLTVTFLFPYAGILGGTLLLCLGILLAGHCHGTVRLGWALLVNEVWGIVSPTEWVSASEFPAWVRRETTSDLDLGLRGARAATWGLVGPRAFRAGWVLQKKQGLFFIFREGRGARTLPIQGRGEKTRLGPVWKTIAYRWGDGPPSALFLQVGLIGPESHK